MHRTRQEVAPIPPINRVTFLMFLWSECRKYFTLKGLYSYRGDIENYNKYRVDVIQASQTPMSQNVHFTFPYHKTKLYSVNVYDHYV